MVPGDLACVRCGQCPVCHDPGAPTACEVGRRAGGWPSAGIWSRWCGRP